MTESGGKRHRAAKEILKRAFFAGTAVHDQDDNETWLIETGHDLIEKKAAAGLASLSPMQRLVYCLWVADYGMRNAGDLETASDLYAPFQDEGRKLAAELSLPSTLAALSLPKADLQGRYFDLFDGVCSELRTAG